MVEFEELIIEGFGSIIKPLRYQLNQRGLNVVWGKNGSGKTSIFSAFCWCLYRQTLKKKNKVTPWKTIQGKDFRGTKVETTFTKDGVKYNVIACEGYKEEVWGAKGGDRMILIEGGKMREDLRDKNDVKKEVEKILGFSFNLLKNTILFGQKLKRIIEETGPDKKMVFDEAFEAGFINQAKKIAEEKLKILIGAINLLEPKNESYETLLESIRRNQEMVDHFENSKQGRIDKLKKGLPRVSKLSVGDLNNKLLKLEKELDKFVEAEDEKLKAENTQFKISLQLGQMKSEVDHARSTLEEIKERYLKVKKTCRLCGQPLNKKDIEKTKANIKLELKKAKKEIEKSKEKLKHLQIDEAVQLSIIASFKDDDEAVRSIENKITKLREVRDRGLEFKKIQKQIEEIESEELPKNLDKQKIKSQLDETLLKQSKTKKRLRKLKKEKDLYSWVINVPLSNSGIKAYIFKEMLNAVNDRLAYYSTYLNYRIEFGINLNSARKDFYSKVFDGQQEIDHDDLSGGQQQLVNVCIAFAIHDVVEGNNEVNCLFMDEVFESLDEDNIEVVSDLIRMKAKDKSVHLITHRKEFVSFGNVLQLKLNKKKQTIALAV